MNFGTPSETSAKIRITRIGKAFTTDFTDGTDGLQREILSSVPIRAIRGSFSALSKKRNGTNRIAHAFFVCPPARMHGARAQPAFPQNRQ